MLICDSALRLTAVTAYNLRMNICLFTQDEITQPLAKRDERTQHIVKVLHKREGDSFSAGIIGGQAGHAVITHIGAKGQADEGELSFTFTPESDGKPLYPLALIVGFPRPIQLRRLLRDVAGLGVCAVHLTGTELGEKSYMESTLVEKGAAYNMLLDGTAQAASTHVPALFMHRTLTDCLNAVCESTGSAGQAAAATAATAEAEPAPAFGKPAGGKQVFSIRTALDNVNAAMSLHDFLAAETRQKSLPAGAPVLAAIGSERGWTDRERRLLEAQGFTRCSMGSRVLRTETAATVACSLILDAMGKLE